MVEGFIVFNPWGWADERREKRVSLPHRICYLVLTILVLTIYLQSEDIRKKFWTLRTRARHTSSLLNSNSTETETQP
jgi:hypothetical protein